MMLGPPAQRKASTAAGPPYVSDVGSRSAISAFAVSKRSAGFCLHVNNRRRSGQGTTTGPARAEHAEHAEHAAGHEQPWRRKTGKVGRGACGRHSLALDVREQLAYLRLQVAHGKHVVAGR